MLSAAESGASGAAQCVDQSLEATREASLDIDSRGEPPRSSLAFSENVCHDELPENDFTFYMSQIAFSDYNTQKSMLLPKLEEMTAQFETHEDSQDLERVQLFSQAKTPSQDYDSVTQSVQRVFQYTSNLVKGANRTNEAGRLTLLIECLADASRIDIWRLPLGAYGIVGTCLDLLATIEKENLGWSAHALRLLSNCCVDPVDAGSADPNKRIIQSRIDLKPILQLLHVQETYKPCLFFIYQLSIEDVRFQERLATHDLLLHVLYLLGSDWFCDDQALDRTCDILQWPACEESLLLQGSEILMVLLRASKVCHISTEVNASLTILMSTILEKSEIKMIDRQILDILLFFQLNRPEDGKQISEFSVSEKGSASADDDADSHDSEERTYQQALLSARKHLTNSLGQLAARADFSESIPTESEVFRLLWGWLSSAEADLQICALLIIGNTAFGSERRNAELAEQRDIIPQLVRIIEHGSHGLVLQSAFEVVQIFSQNPQTRLSFGQHGMLEAMSRSWQQGTDTQLRMSALHHTRQLLHKSLGNIYRVVDERPQPNALPLIHHVMALFRESQTADVRVQCGLIVVEIWHTFLATSRETSAPFEDPNSSQDMIVKSPEGPIPETGIDPNRRLESCDTRDPNISSLRCAMVNMCLVYSDIIKPFLAVLSSGNPSLATRTWLTLALMSREPTCADVLYNTLIDGEGSAVFRAVLADQEKARSKDASNARFLLYELKQRYTADVERTADLSSLWQTLA